MQMITALLIVFGGAIFLSLLAFAFYIFYDRFVRQPNYIRAIIILRTGGFSLAWLKKLSEEKSNYKLAYNPKYGKFAYFEKDIIAYRHYNAGFFAEDSCTSLQFILTPIDVKKNHKAYISLPITEANQKLNLVVNDVLHPKTLQDIMDTKLLGELTGKDVDMMQVAILIISVIVIIGLAVLFWKIGKVQESVDAMHGNMTQMFDMINNRFLISKGGAVIVK